MKKFFLLFSLMVVSLAFVSCGSDEEDEPNYANQTMVAGDTYTIPGKIKDWASDNELIASVSNGIVTAERVGETIIRSGSKSFKVSVTGKYNTFKEPYTQWGASQSAVKSYMTGYTLFKETNEVLYYTGLNKEMGYGYSFTNSALSSSYVILQMTSVTSDEMVAYLAERYVYVTMDEDDYYFGFVTPDKKTVVILQLQSNSGQLYYFVYYTSASSANAAPAQAMMMMKQHFGSAKQTLGTETKEEYLRMLNDMPDIQPEFNLINK